MLIHVHVGIAPMRQFQLVHVPIAYDNENKDAYQVSYTTLTNFSTKYLVLRKVYTDVDGIK